MTERLVKRVCLSAHPSGPGYESFSRDLHKTNVPDHATSIRKDPVTALPLEISHLILSNISYRQHVQLLRVSKAWNKVASTSTLLMDMLSFPTSWSLVYKKPCQVTPAMVEAALKRWILPKTLRIASLTTPAAEYLMEQLQCGHRLNSLEHVDVHGISFSAMTLSMLQDKLKSLVLDRHTEVSLDWICDALLPRCCNLEEARFSCVAPSGANLTLKSNSLKQLELDLYVGDRMPMSEYHRFSGLPNLRLLDCKGLYFYGWSMPLDLRYMESLSFLAFSDSHNIPNLLLPDSISTLTIRDCDFQEQQAVQLDTQEFPALSNLETLDLFANIYPEFILQAARKTTPGRLRHCSVEEQFDMDTNVMALIETAWFREIESLSLIGVLFDDSDAQQFISALPFLTKLYIEDNPDITDEFLKHLIYAPSSKIRQIVLRNCSEVPEEMKSWGEEVGVDMTIVNG